MFKYWRRKVKTWTCRWRYMKGQRIIKVIRILQLGATDVWTKFHSNQSNCLVIFQTWSKRWADWQTNIATCSNKNVLSVLLSFLSRSKHRHRKDHGDGPGQEGGEGDHGLQGQTASWGRHPGNHPGGDTNQFLPVDFTRNRPAYLNLGLTTCVYHPELDNIAPGVPQGFILGPLLVCRNSINVTTRWWGSLHCYADDTQIYMPEAQQISPTWSDLENHSD